MFKSIILIETISKAFIKKSYLKLSPLTFDKSPLNNLMKDKSSNDVMTLKSFQNLQFS